MPPDLVRRCVVSFIFFVLTQSALSLVPLFFSAASLLLQLSLSCAVLLAAVGFGSRCRKLIGIAASAPALVFFNIFFVWGVYLAAVRKAVSHAMDFAFNGEVVMLLVGLCSIIASDPGFVECDPNASEELAQSSVLGVESCDERRVRYCKSCKAYVKGFDHHCPAFGNCIGQNNHVLFMILLVGFVITEASYVVFSSQYARRFGILNGNGSEANLTGTLAKSTMLFSLFQIFWQVPFLAWHLYCVCFNIRTDEWINWKKYQEFHHTTRSHPGENFDRLEFRNPYDIGIIQNVKEFLTVKV